MNDSLDHTSFYADLAQGPIAIQRISTAMAGPSVVAVASPASYSVSGLETTGDLSKASTSKATDGTKGFKDLAAEISLARMGEGEDPVGLDFLLS